MSKVEPNIAVKPQPRSLCLKFSIRKSQMHEGLRQPFVRENNTNHIIIHVGISDLNSEATLERIVKSTVEVAKNTKHKIIQ